MAKFFGSLRSYLKCVNASGHLGSKLVCDPYVLIPMLLMNALAMLVMPSVTREIESFEHCYCHCYRYHVESPVRISMALIHSCCSS